MIALNDNGGFRCQQSGVTVGYIRSELMTRANAGKYKPDRLPGWGDEGFLRSVLGLNGDLLKSFGMESWARHLCAPSWPVSLLARSVGRFISLLGLQFVF